MNKSGRPSNNSMTPDNAQPQAKGMDKARPPSDNVTVEPKHKTVIHKSAARTPSEKSAGKHTH